MKAVLFGMGAFLMYAVFVNTPAPMEGVVAEGLGGVILLLCVLAYVGGRYHGRGFSRAAASATAVARATSEARSNVQVFVGGATDTAPAAAAAGDEGASTPVRRLASGAVLLDAHRPRSLSNRGETVQDLTHEGSRGGLADHAEAVLRESGALDDGELDW